MLDLRLPAGLFFLVVGLILAVMGVMNPANLAPLTPVNVNLVAGSIMVAFGGFLLVLAQRARKR